MAQRLGDVARKAGVSEATVSRVLNGRPGVSESTRAAVLTALDVLGYERPTQLRGDRARLVGLVLPELENPIFPALAEVVGGGAGAARFHARAVHQDGRWPVRGGVREHADPAAGVRGGRRPGGHFAEDDSPHDHYRLLHDRGVPVMLVNAAVDQLGFPRVSTDDVVAVEQAFGHLWSLGHTRIGAIVGPVDHMPSRRKVATLATECERAGTRGSWWSTRCSASRAVTRPAPGSSTAGITGIIRASDQLALGAIRAPRRAPWPSRTTSRWSALTALP